MKNEDIFNHVDQQDLRLACATLIHGPVSGSQFAIDHIHRQIETLQKQLVAEQQAFAGHTLIKQMGWQEWDVSDEVSYPEWDAYRAFIGTEQEYQQLKERIAGERNDR